MREYLRFADETICIVSRQPFSIGPALRRFLTEEGAARTELRLEFADLPLRQETLAYVGDDFFRRYYTDGKITRVEMKGAGGKPSAALFCGEGELHYQIYQSAGRGITGWISLLPMPWLLYPAGVLFLHASRVEVRGKAIVFVGASGVGKTTQAFLWKTYGGGKIMGNDRVLLRRVAGQWQTYGYFEDGDSPVCDPERLPLAAVVLLEQGPENTVFRMPTAKAAAGLMSQTAVEPWDKAMMQTVLEELIGLVRQCPVYSLRCRADAGAVACLEEKMKQDGVIPWA